MNIRPVPSDEQLVARHLDADGRLASMPVKPDRRLLLLRHVADRIPIGVDLDEFAVNNLLRGFSDDVATLRRDLVDARLLQRRSPGHYLRLEDTDGDPADGS